MHFYKKQIVFVQGLGFATIEEIVREGEQESKVSTLRVRSYATGDIVDASPGMTMETAIYIRVLPSKYPRHWKWYETKGTPKAFSSLANASSYASKVFNFLQVKVSAYCADADQIITLKTIKT